MAKDTSNPFLDWYNSGALTVSEEQRVFFKKQAKELIEEAKQKLKENGKDYLALFQLAIGYYYNRRYKEAIPYFEKALEVNEEPRLLFYFANCLCLAETGLDKAALVLGEVADHYKKEPSFYNAKGILHSKRKEYITAIKYYEKALAINPEDYIAWTNKGVGLSGLNKHQEADLAFDIAIKYKPDFYDAWFNKGICLIDLKQFEKAIAAFDKVILFDPENILAVVNKGGVLCNLGRYEEAIHILNQGLKIDQSNSSIKVNIGAALISQSKFDHAIEILNDVIEVEPDNCDALNSKGIALIELGKYEEALKYLNLVIAINPQYASAHINKGNILGINKKYSEAITCYETAIGLEPENTNAYNGLGIVFFYSMKFDEAYYCFEKAKAIDPQNIAAFYNQGNLFFASSRFEEALEAYNQVLQYDEHHVNAWINKGNSLYSLKLYSEAIDSLDKALVLEPENYKAWNSKGNTLQKVKKPREAIECFEKASKYGDDWIKRRAKQKIEDLKVQIKVTGYSELKDTINKIETLLRHEPDTICHYTRQQISYLVLLCREGKHDGGDQENASPFQISAGSFLNDPSEGQILETFLGIDTGNIEQSNYESQFAAKPFIGSFVPAELYNDLNLWRMYGDEARGCSITFRLRDFQQALYDQLPKSPPEKGEGKEAEGKVQEKGPKEYFPCYWVAYYDRRKDTFFIPGQESLEKELKHLMEELKERYQDMLEKQEAGSTLPITITERLNDIAYLFKLSEYKAEQEIRLIVNPALFPKQFEFGHGGHRVFMSTVAIRNLTTRICLGPKMPEANQFASLLHYHFEQDNSIEDKPEIILSHLPYQ